ncbi:MAG: DHA2 family efflux MFS transporter permease subunit [Chloroflexi bacterium]|uniref:DHA2 family efflux MFS transporter permease subunit n=1 Tax=Candidatus Chlorohelix allophototropha TaxID=3003348 RepID=A0A8T7M647_9CHLR|nr:DHA2 family efflux MFS transporter permease subunit [Chloroflexota bacterium]WJW69509.1 DHA2 family efflux MFS transporter permease subunit [Chloroflexota bacterium L227-S17]
MTKGRKYAIALTAALGLIMGILDNTIVNIALVPIAKELKIDLSTVQWLVTGYFLAQAAVIPVAGYLGNRFGSRRIFMGSVAIFTLGSLLCGVTQDPTMLITFRVLQGIGAGALFPLGQALALDPFEPHERPAAMSLLVIPILLGPILGPILGGWLNDSFGWQYLFLINVPIGFITVFLTWRVMPHDHHRTPEELAKSKQFDYVGLVLSTMGVLGIVYGFSLVNEVDPATRTQLNPSGIAYGWGYWLVWTLVGVGTALVAAFCLYELRRPDPMLDLRMFKKYSFTIATIVSCVISGTVFGALLLLPVFLQQIRTPHLTALDTGLALIPQGIGSLIGAGLGGPLFNKLGGRIITGAGAIFVIIALWQFGNLTPTTDGWAMTPWNFLLGMGLGLTFIPSQTLAFLSLRGTALTKASSLLNVTRQIAGSVATAITITLLGQQTTYHFNLLQADAIKNLPAGAPTPNPADPQYAQAMQQLGAQAGTNGINDVFIYLAIGTVLVFLLSFALPSRKNVIAMEEEAERLHGSLEVAPIHIG